MRENEIFDRYMRSLPTNKRLIKLRDICTACVVSINVVYAWRLGRTRLKQIYMDKISETIGENIFKGVEK